MLRFEHVSLSYGSQKIIDDISFEIQEGQMAVLIGSSGCGKTTTLKMINRLIEPTSGKIYINGKDIAAQTGWSCAATLAMSSSRSACFPT